MSTGSGAGLNGAGYKTHLQLGCQLSFHVASDGSRDGSAHNGASQGG